MYGRLLRLLARPARSFFPWGPRQTGKITFRKTTCPDALRIDLLKTDKLMRYLLLHLLFPAGRPVQITQNLNSSWDTTHFEVKKDLMGRYPKYNCPVNPSEAVSIDRAVTTRLHNYRLNFQEWMEKMKR